MGVIFFINSFILFIFYLNFSLNEEVLLFFTFSIFFFIFVKSTSITILDFLRTIRYKIYYKFIKIINILNISLNDLRWVYYWTSLANYVLEVYYIVPIANDKKNLEV